MGPPSRDIPRPAELQRDVDFWIRVYSEITTQQGFLHDEADLDRKLTCPVLALWGADGLMQSLMDIEALMSSADMGLMESVSALH